MDDLVSLVVTAIKAAVACVALAFMYAAAVEYAIWRGDCYRQRLWKKIKDSNKKLVDEWRL